MSRLVQPLAWDTHYFGCRIGKLSVRRVTAKFLIQADAACRKLGIRCLYYLTSRKEQDAALLRKHGFRRTDVRFEMQASLAQLKKHALPSVLRVRKGKRSDIAALRRVALAAHDSGRFYDDPRMPRHPARTFYAQWVENALKGLFDDVVWVAERDGRPAGYITCSKTGPGRGRIGLLSVGPAHQGKGVGHALVARSLDWFGSRGIRTISVVTSEDNRLARQFYRQCGFRAHHIGSWYHKWYGGKK